MAVKLTEQTNGPHIYMRLRLDSGRIEEIDAYITEKALCYQRGPHPGGTAADHCGVSYAALTCFLYISGEDAGFRHPLPTCT